MTFRDEATPTPLYLMAARAITDQVQHQLAPMKDASREEEAWLTICFMRNEVCRLIVNVARDDNYQDQRTKRTG